jgi:hypothetical protein
LAISYYGTQPTEFSLITLALPVYELLCAPTVNVIDIDAIADNPRLPRKERAVTDMTELGKICREQAIIEFERCFLGSELDTRLDGGSDANHIVINERILAATLLDLRTVRCPHLSLEQKTAAKDALKTRYVTFFVTAKQVQRKNAEEKKVNEESRKLPASPEKKSKVKAKKDHSTTLVGLMFKSTSHNSAEGFFSDDEDDEDECVPPVKTEEDYVAEDKEKASAEFKIVFKNWFHLEISWSAEFPEADLEDKVPLDLINDLTQINIGYLKILTGDPDRTKFVFLPLMAGRCDSQIGTLNAESFSERVISSSNLVMTDGNTLLCDTDFEMLVVLRMKREFMLCMRENYFQEIMAMQPFNMAIPVEVD